MPRRRSIKIVCLTAVLLACGVAGYVAMYRHAAEASFNGRSASDWLGAVYGNNGMQQRQALEAFRQMGSNAEPVLVAGVASQETFYAKMLRRIYPRLPSMIQQHLRKPADLRELRDAASLVVMNVQLPDIVPKLLHLLATPDSGLRETILSTVLMKIGPQDAGQISFLLLAANDPDAAVRTESITCLGRLGLSGSNGAPTALKLCADTNITVRIHAARTLWKITGQTNAAVPILQDTLLGLQTNADQLHWAACCLLEMRRTDARLIPIFINSVTNVQTAIRLSACSCLAQIGHPAAAAIPALRQVLQDPNQEVQERAKVALTKIDPEHAAANSP